MEFLLLNQFGEKKYEMQKVWQDQLQMRKEAVIEVKRSVLVKTIDNIDEEADLRKKAKLWTGTRSDLSDLFRKMESAAMQSNAIGIAAPQIGEDWAVILVRFIKTDHWKLFVNPTILQYSPKTYETWEGCLSIPGKEFKVSRSTLIKVKYIDDDNREREEWIDGWMSQIIQHEVDHLNGILICDKEIKKDESHPI